MCPPLWHLHPPRSWFSRCRELHSAPTSVSCMGRNLNSDSQTGERYLCVLTTELSREGEQVDASGATSERGPPLLSCQPPPSEPRSKKPSPRGLPLRTANGVSGENGGTGFLLGLRPKTSQGGDGKLNKPPCDGCYLLAPYWQQPSRDPGEPWTGPEIKLPFQDNKPGWKYHADAAERCQWRFGD